MTRYNEEEADYMDRLIRSALIAAAERLYIPKEWKQQLLNKLMNQAKRIDRL